VRCLDPRESNRVVQLSEYDIFIFVEPDAVWKYPMITVPTPRLQRVW